MSSAEVNEAELRTEIEQLRRDLEIWRRNGGDILLRAEIDKLTNKLRAANNALVEAGFMLGKSRQENKRLKVALQYVLPALKGNDLPAEEEHVERALGIRE